MYQVGLQPEQTLCLLNCFLSSIPHDVNEEIPNRQIRSASIEMTTSRPIRFANTCPTILVGHTYEYHMQDGIFSFVDVTPTKAAQVIDEEGGGVEK